jgi:hypothetical protein
MKPVFFVLFLLLVPTLMAQSKGAVGQWEGESICTVKNSPCHDEHVIYRITRDSSAVQKLKIAAYKIVNGDELYMGDLDCRYVTEASEFRCQNKPTDLWVYNVNGDIMTGTLTINGSTLYRRINLKRVAATAVKQP